MFLMKKPEELSNREMEPGETLFQYLKRKKQFALRESVEKEFEELKHLRQVENSNDNSVAIKQKEVEKHAGQESSQKKISTKRKQRKSTNKKKKIDNSFESSKNSTKEKENNFSLINTLRNDIFNDDRTTKRTALHKNDNWNIIESKDPEENETKRSRSPFRTFISMISPLKNRIENPTTNLSNTKLFTKQSLDDEKRREMIKTTEISTKKIVKEAMGKVQKRYNKQVEFEMSVTEKIREFILLVNSFLIHIEVDLSEDESTEKKLTQVKSTMKLLNSFIQTRTKEEKERGDISEEIDALYGELSQVLDQYENQMSKNSQFMKETEIERIKKEFEAKIEELTKEKTRLGREIAMMNKESARVEKDYNKLLEECHELKEEREKWEQLNRCESSEMKALYEEEINELTAKNSDLRESLQQLTKQLKLSEYNLEENKRKMDSERQDKTSARESYLLKEITLLREDCARDIENISNFYKTKLDQYPEKINALEIEREEQKVRIYSLTEKVLSLESAIKLSETERLEARQKLECSLVDMCKLNEELFKHWLALKDIKTLSLRLGVFDKFERIYRDVPFDDAMFIL